MQSPDRRTFIRATGGATITGAFAGCSGDGDDGGTDAGNGGGSVATTGGGSGGDSARQIGISQHQSGGSWITAFFDSGKIYAQNRGHRLETFVHENDAATQISQVRRMINQEYDGIVLVPYNESLDSVIEEAANAGIPVFTANQDATTEAVESFTAFGNENAGRICGERMYQALTAQRSAVDTYRVLNVRGDFIPSSNARTDGFRGVMDGKDDVEIVDTIQTDWTQSDAQSKVQTWLNGNDPPHGVYSSNMTSGLGTFQALEDQGLAVPRGEDGHVVVTQLDGGPDVNPKILDGYVDAAVDQPVTFYLPLAIKQMEGYWENGDDAVPAVDAELTADDYSFDPVEHRNGTLWSEPTWAPATVVEKDGHPYVQTNGVTLTEENADEPYLWGNVWG